MVQEEGKQVLQQMEPVTNMVNKGNLLRVGKRWTTLIYIHTQKY